jgi:alkylation response protein AidB-like acyl-CoA dehydrogenase
LDADADRRDAAKAVQHSLARAYAQLLSARLSVYDAARAYDRGD